MGITGPRGLGILSNVNSKKLHELVKTTDFLKLFWPSVTWQGDVIWYTAMLLSKHTVLIAAFNHMQYLH